MNTKKLKHELQTLRAICEVAHKDIEAAVGDYKQGGVYSNILATVDSLRYRCRLGIECIDEYNLEIDNDTEEENFLETL